jgi:hypothetical protein
MPHRAAMVKAYHARGLHRSTGLSGLAESRIKTPWATDATSTQAPVPRLNRDLRQGIPPCPSPTIDM